MLHKTLRSWRPSALLALALCSVVSFSSFTHQAEAQSTASPTAPLLAPSSSATASTGLQPSPIPIPPPIPPTPHVPLPPGTRELQDSQLVEDTVAIGQLQTYHFSITQQHLPVRRQLERILFHPGVQHGNQFDKRQAVGAPSGTVVQTTTLVGSATTAAPVPTRTIVPALPPPFSNGTYAVYISISTCQSPKSASNAVCPPLTLYVSTSASQPLPGPGQDPKVVQTVSSVEGLVQFTAYTSQDVFFSLQGPALDATWSGSWAVEVGASSQGKKKG